MQAPKTDETHLPEVDEYILLNPALIQDNPLFKPASTVRSPTL